MDCPEGSGHLTSHVVAGAMPAWSPSRSKMSRAALVLAGGFFIVPTAVGDDAELVRSRRPDAEESAGSRARVSWISEAS